ncbi:MAG: 50S ribosomal protein L29 [Candidatus Saccharimonadales bacterium]
MAKKLDTKQVKANKSIEELKAELVAKRNDLVEAQKGHKLGELTNPRVLSTLRKEIARIMTSINSKQINQKSINVNKESK